MRMRYGISMARTGGGWPWGGINNANGFAALKQLICNSCPTNACPNHHDFMVLGVGHRINLDKKLGVTKDLFALSIQTLFNLRAGFF